MAVRRRREGAGAHRQAQILIYRTDLSRRRSMNRFLRGYAGRPTRITSMAPDDDATADEFLAITCRPGDVESVQLIWGWIDDAWRAFPADTEYPNGKFGDYPCCR